MPWLRTSRDEADLDEGGPERVAAFSDGVMAVIITLMALDLRQPPGAGFADLRRSLPYLLIYVLSFAFIGIYWNNHHHLIRRTDRIGAGVMWSNLLLLFWLSLIPFVTEWMAHYYSHHLPAAAYGVVALGSAISYTVLVRAIVAVNGRDSVVASAIGPDVKGWASMVAYLTAIGVAFWTPYASYALYGGVAVVWFVPDRRLARSSEPTGAPDT